MADDRSSLTPLRRSAQLLRAVQHALFVSMVVLGMTRSLFDDGVGAGEVAAGAALLGWYAVGSARTARSSTRATKGTRPTTATNMWLVGLSVLCVAAVWASPDFAWVSFAVFVVHANALAPAAAITTIAAVAVATGSILVVRWPDDGHWAAQIIGPVVGAAVAGALVGITRLASAETAARQRLLEELLATRDELARAYLEAGTTAERERLSREIHDTLAQGFASVVLAARRARHATQRGAAEAALDDLDHLEAVGRAGLEDARRLVRQLPPAELEGRPLPAALDLLAGRGRAAEDPTVEVRVDGDAWRLPPGVDAALLRVAQEAVANARRHANADRVVITLTYQPHAVRLDVADDGIGFDGARSSNRGFGLSSMRSRVEQLGGTFVVESLPGHGVAVNATVPIERSASERFA